MPSNISKVSVIMVTYNAAKTIQITLNTIFAQSYTNLELVVIDGKSTDGTVEILQANQDKIDFWLSEKDTGVYDAMNKALNYISGEWVYFIGADDELRPEFSEMLRELTDPTSIYYGDVFADGERRMGEQSPYRLAKFGIYHQAMIYPASVFKKYRYNLKYRISADFALTLQLCGDKNYHFVYKDYVLANFNHTGLSGLNVDELFQKDKAKLIYKYFGFKIWLRYRIHKYKRRDNPRA